MLWPYPLLARRDDAVGIHRILQTLAQFHQRIVIPVIRPRYLVHEFEMRAIFAVTRCRGILDQVFEQGMCVFLDFLIMLVEHKRVDVMHLAPTDDEHAHVVETEFRRAISHHDVLLERVVTGGGRDWREVDMATTANPVDETEFTKRGNARHGATSTSSGSGRSSGKKKRAPGT